MPPERKTIWLLCLAAALRVLVFSAAFPFFNNVDEDAHFDLAVKYSHGEIPRRLAPMSAETAHYLALYGSVEYLWKPENLPDGKIPPPLWTLPADAVEKLLPPNVAQFQSATNHESSNAPLYYGVAGAWLNAGKLFRQQGGFLLYWIRFLNVFFAAALVWLGYAAAKIVFPERPALRIGVALLLAFFPQDIFYSIQSDVLSPLAYGAAFLGLLQCLRADALPARLAGFTSLSLAATWLVKTSNLPLLGVATLAVLFKIVRLAKENKLRTALPALALLAVCALAPIGAWMLWSRHAFGDLTGSGVKIEFLGWTRKPFGQWWHHPIFTPHGGWTFAHDLIASFWRGEFVWLGERIASPAMDAFYFVVSVLFVAIAVAGLAKKTAPVPQRQALGLAFASVAAGVVFLALISIVFDFGNCFYPSPAYPYFTSGRLMSGALVPFALLFVHGLDRALAWFTKTDRARLLALGAIVLAVTGSELLLNLPAFFSRYNWFHL